VDINNKKRAKYHDIDMEVDVNKNNSDKQHKDIDQQKVIPFPPHIKVENNILYLKQCFIYI
jgi:hypothetical protein